MIYWFRRQDNGTPFASGFIFDVKDKKKYQQRPGNVFVIKIYLLKILVFKLPRLFILPLVRLACPPIPCRVLTCEEKGIRYVTEISILHKLYRKGYVLEDEPNNFIAVRKKSQH